MNTPTRCTIVVSLVTLASAAQGQQRLWLEHFGTNDWEELYAAAEVGSGGVYFGGSTEIENAPVEGVRDAWLRRYDSAGNELWAREFDVSIDTWAITAAPDGVDGVYVAGSTDNGFDPADAWVARYDAAGNKLWLESLDYPDSWAYTDVVFGSASDGAGGVYVTGTTEGDLAGPNAGGYDAWLARYDGAGNQRWARQFGTDQGDRSRAAAAEVSGDVFVAGSTYGSLAGPNAGGSDVWVGRFDSGGNQLWIRQIGTSERDLPLAACPDAAGGVYVCGETWGDLGGPNAGYIDAWLARYDGAGNQLWVRQLGTIQGDWAYGAARTGAGGVYVVGGTTDSLGGPNAGTHDAWLARYDSSGNQIWIHQIGTSSFESARAATGDRSGGLYLGGRTGGSFGGPFGGLVDVWMARFEGDPVALRYCSPAVANSTTQPGALGALGSNVAQDDRLRLVAYRLPQDSLGFFITSQTQDLIVGPGGSQGNLCLGGAIGRYVGPGQVGSSGSGDSIELVLDLPETPTPGGFVQILAGETWNFTAWYRDLNPHATSNFTDAISITFR